MLRHIRKSCQCSTDSIIEDFQTFTGINIGTKVCGGSVMKWVSMAEELHTSLTSHSPMVNSGLWSSAWKPLVEECWRVLNSLFSVFQSDGWVWVWQMPGELTCKLKNISVKLVCNVRLCFKRWFYLLSVTLVMFLCPESMSHLSSLLWKIHPQTVMNMK